MRIQVITKDNGYGLSKDVQVLREAFEPAGHEVVFTPWDRTRNGVRFHWNIHLELLNPHQFRTAGINVFVPNPEWMMPEYPRYLKEVDMVLTKSREGQRIMETMHASVRNIGWTSPDTTLRVDYTRTDMVHLAGDSISKGTQAVVDAASMTKAAVTVGWKQKLRGPIPGNVRFIHGKVDGLQADELRRAPIHLCPSSAEGFGHYINEARAMGALIVTTNAAPMNELVTAEFGFLVPACSTHPMRFATEHRVCPDALAECMQMAAEEVRQHGPTWGARARAAYEADRTSFTTAINELIR